MERTEQLIKAKIPGKETGIEIRRTICDICCPSFHCGIDAYVKDGRVIKVEGTKGHPMSDGLLCTKGLSNREYIYRRDRILTPLKRVGERGEGKFQEITWEEAYRICAEKLNGWKEKEGADSVLFFGGYTKWFRPWLHRLAFSFGTENYATESSTCFTSGFMAWKIATGRGAKGDMAHCGVYLGWAFNPYHSRYLNGKKADEAKARGVKFIIVDPRITPAVEKLADIHLRPRGGTDGALALAMANILIQNNWIDREYIDQYVEGFDAFAEYVSGFNESNLEAITGVPYSQAVEAQATDMARQILEEKPYPIRAVVALGMNLRMLPDTENIIRALKKLDFFVDTDLFMTDAAKYADIVLPACSSFERGEFKTYPGGYAVYTNPVIEPLGQAKSDAQILCELAEALGLDDELLKSGYENCIRYMIRNLSVTVEELKANPLPTLVPERKPYQEGAYIRGGLDTKSGKFELDSSLIKDHPEWGLDSLPTYCDSLDGADEEKYPFALCAGARIPNAIHSRLHEVPWVRSLRPHPTADISLEDGKRLGIREGDDMEIYTEKGSITVKAHPTARVLPGTVYMYHGYREANVNGLLDGNHLDPYCGFPSYRSARCGIRKGGQDHGTDA